MSTPHKEDEEDQSTTRPGWGSWFLLSNKKTARPRVESSTNSTPVSKSENRLSQSPASMRNNDIAPHPKRPPIALKQPGDMTNFVDNNSSYMDVTPTALAGVLPVVQPPDLLSGTPASTRSQTVLLVSETSRSPWKSPTPTSSFALGTTTRSTISRMTPRGRAQRNRNSSLAPLNLRRPLSKFTPSATISIKKRKANNDPAELSARIGLLSDDYRPSTTRLRANQEYERIIAKMGRPQGNFSRLCNRKESKEVETKKLTSTGRRNHVTFSTDEVDNGVEERFVATPASHRPQKRKLTPHKTSGMEDSGDEDRKMIIATPLSSARRRVKSKTASKPLVYDEMPNFSMILTGNDPFSLESERITLPAPIKGEYMAPPVLMQRKNVQSSVSVMPSEDSMTIFDQQPSEMTATKQEVFQNKKTRPDTLPDTSWKCTSCGTVNQEDVSWCANNKCLNRVAMESNANGWGSLFQQKEGEWKCPTCSVFNNRDSRKCVACETPNPKEGNPPASSANTSEPTSASAFRKSLGATVTKTAPGSIGASGFTFGGFLGNSTKTEPVSVAGGANDRDISGNGSIDSGGFVFGGSSNSQTSKDSFSTNFRTEASNKKSSVIPTDISSTTTNGPPKPMSGWNFAGASASYEAAASSASAVNGGRSSAFNTRAFLEAAPPVPPNSANSFGSFTAAFSSTMKRPTAVAEDVMQAATDAPREAQFQFPSFVNKGNSGGNAFSVGSSVPAVPFTSTVPVAFATNNVDTPSTTIATDSKDSGSARETRRIIEERGPKSDPETSTGVMQHNTTLSKEDYSTGDNLFGVGGQSSNTGDQKNDESQPENAIGVSSHPPPTSTTFERVCTNEKLSASTVNEQASKIDSNNVRSTTGGGSTSFSSSSASLFGSNINSAPNPFGGVSSAPVPIFGSNTNNAPIFGSATTNTTPDFGAAATSTSAQPSLGVSSTTTYGSIPAPSTAATESGSNPGASFGSSSAPALGTVGLSGVPVPGLLSAPTQSTVFGSSSAQASGSFTSSAAPVHSAPFGSSAALPPDPFGSSAAPTPGSYLPSAAPAPSSFGSSVAQARTYGLSAAPAPNAFGSNFGAAPAAAPFENAVAPPVVAFNGFANGLQGSSSSFVGSSNQVLYGGSLQPNLSGSFGAPGGFASGSGFGQHQPQQQLNPQQSNFGGGGFPVAQPGEQLFSIGAAPAAAPGKAGRARRIIKAKRPRGRPA